MERFEPPTGPRALDHWLAVAPWPIHRLDPEGTPYGPNPALAALLGYNVGELDASTLGRRIPERTCSRLVGAATTSPDRPYREMALTYRHRNGIDIRAGRARIGPFDTPGTPLLVMLEEIRPDHRLDRAKVQSRISRLIAHDLNNVFTVAKSYVELARRGDSPPHLANNYLQRAAQAVQRGIRVSRQLQTIIIEKPFPTEPTCIRQVVERIQPFVARLLPTGPEWAIHCQRSLPQLRSHPALLSRFLIDFGINAHLRWPHCEQMEMTVRRSPAKRPTVLVRIHPADPVEGLPVPFRLFLCQPDPFSPDQLDPLFVSDILAGEPIAVDKSPRAITALLPGTTD